MRKPIIIIVITVLVVMIISIIFGLLFFVQNMESSSESTDTSISQNVTQSQTKELTIKDRDIEILTITLDNDFGIGDFVMDNENTLTDNPTDSESSNNRFSYFVNESEMTYFFQSMYLNTTYLLTYPLSDNDLNEAYLYYTEMDGEKFGAFYDWDMGKPIGEYETSQIVLYSNIPTSDSALFGEDSVIQSQFCIFRLFDIDPTQTGYLVYSGLRPVESSVDFCNELAKLNIFEISF
jgi:hypothetical protein